MNILIFSWRGPGHPFAGGAEQITHEHAKIWVKAGHKVTLFTSSTNSSKSEIIDGVKIVRFGDQVFGVRLGAICWYLFGKHEKFDLIFDHFHGIPFFTPLFVRNRKVAFIHEVGKEVWKLNPWPWPWQYLPALLGSRAETMIIKLYKRMPFLTVSESTREDLASWGIDRSKITVIHNGTNLITHRIKVAKTKVKTAIYLGALAKDKGIEDAIDSFSILSELDNEWQFWVVGKSDKIFERSLIEKCKKLGIYDKVKFWGFVPEKEKFDLLAAAHILINPSVREGWGLVNIEANSVGTPVVGYKVPGIIDSVSSASGITIDKEMGPKGLADAASELVNDGGRYSTLCKTAVIWSAQFTWEEAGRKSLEFIKKITKLNILILSWRGPSDPNAGGAEYVAHEHAKAWVKEGHQVTLFTSFFKNAKDYEVLDGVEIKRKGSVLLGVHVAAFFWYLFGHHDRFDLVIDHFHGIPFFTPLYVRVKKLAVIHEIAREIWMVNQIRFPLNIAIGAIGYVSEPLLFRLFYKRVPFLTGSKSTKDELILLGIPRENITIIHHAISTNQRVILTGKEKIVTFLGSLARDKGIEDALKVFNILNTTQNRWKFWVIGKGDDTYLSHLKSMIKDYSLGSKIVFWGFVSDDRRNKLLAKSFVLVNPSLKEGWGLVNIEANAFGTPVVGYNVPGTRDSVIDGKTGLLCDQGDFNDLAGNILKLESDRKMYSVMQKEGNSWSNQFKWENLTQESTKLIESIVNS